MFGSVYWSVAEVNRRSTGVPKKLNSSCPRCGTDLWHVWHGVDPQYRSRYNPGEYVRYTCVCCGYQEEYPS